MAESILTEHLKDEFKHELNLLLRDLLKVVKILSLYPDDNPLPTRMRSSISTKFVELVNRYDGLKFDIREEEILYLGDTVFQDSGRDESLAEMFYQAGIITLEFRIGLSIGDFNAFLNLLKNFSNDCSTDRDLVTLLWQENFEFIHFLTLEDLALDNLNSEITINELYPNYGVEDERGLDFAAILAFESPDDEDEPEYEGGFRECELSDEQEDGLRQMELSGSDSEDGPFLNFLKKGAELVREDTVAVQKLVEENRCFDHYRCITRIMIDILRFWDDREKFDETVVICDKILDELLKSGAFAAAADFVHSLRNFQIEMVQDKKQTAARLTEFMRRAGDSSHVERLTDIINRQEKIDISSISTYLESLGWESLSHIVKMLARLVARESRMMVCDYLVRNGRKNLSVIGKEVYSKKWFVVRNAVYIMGRIGTNEVLHFLKISATNPEVRVREETIEALLLVKTEEAAAILAWFLNDEEPRLRRLALDHLGRIGGSVSFKAIGAVILSRDFFIRTLEEQSGLLATYSRIGGSEVVEVLAGLIGGSSLFSLVRKTDLRLAALRALAHNNSEEAEAKILKLSRSWRRWLRRAAGDALKYRQRHLNSREVEHG